MIVLCIIAIGFSAGLLLLSAALGLSEARAGSPEFVHGAIQAFVSMSAWGWIAVTPFRWRTKPLEIGALAAVAAGQLSLWEMLRLYDPVHVWSVLPTLLAAIAILSVPLGFGAFLVRYWLDWSKSRVDS